MRTYPDEASAGTARTRLAKLASGSGDGAVARSQDQPGTPRRVLEGHEAGLLDASRDGRFAVGTQRRGYGSFDLILRDLVTGRVSPLGTSEISQSGSQPRVSDDGRLVAYSVLQSWPESSDQAVHLVGTEPGAVPRVAISQDATRFFAADWAPDGKSLLVMSAPAVDPAKPRADWAKLGVLHVETGTMRTLKTFEGWQSWEGLLFASFSPDGRYVAYMRQPQEGSDDRYLETVDAQNGEVSLVAGTAAPRRWPTWTLDGGHIVYVQGRGDLQSVLAVPVREGRVAGEPVVIQERLEGRPLTMTASGTLLSRRLVEGGNFTHVVDRQPGSGNRLNSFEGFGASWSPDGRSVAFMRNRGDDVSVIVRDVASGQERSFTKGSLGSAVPPLWTADSSTLLVHGRGEGTQAMSLYKVDLRSGTFQALFALDTATRKRSFGAVSPDGRTVYLAKANEAGTAVTEIVAVDAGTGVERTVAMTGEGTVSTPAAADLNRVPASLAVSPDGKTLAVMAYTSLYQTARIFTVGVDGSGAREVIGSVAAGWLDYSGSLRWTRDGQSLLFVAFDAQKNWRIMRVPATGGTPQPDGLDFDTLQSLLPDKRLFAGNFNGFDLSPDGSRIVVSTLTASKSEVWALDNVAALIEAKR